MAKFRFSDLDTLFPGAHVQRVMARAIAAHNALLEPFGLTLRDLAILVYAQSDKPVRLSDIAAQAVTDVSSISRGITSLVARGLMKRVHSEGDRRTIELSLTPKGQEMFDKAYAAVSPLTKALWADVTETEYRQFKSVTTKLEAVLHETPGPKKTQKKRN